MLSNKKEAPLELQNKDFKNIITYTLPKSQSMPVRLEVI